MYKIKINTKTRILVLIALLLVLLTGHAKAISIGASPATAYFDIIRSNGYAERPILVSTSGENVSVSVSAEGEIADWLSFKKDFIVLPKKPYNLDVTLNPPLNIEPDKSYKGTLRFTASQEQTNITNQKNQSGAETSVDVGIEIELIARVISCEATFKKILNQTSTILEINLLNNGSAEFKPHILVDIWDSKIENLIKRIKIQNRKVLPKKQEKFIINLGELKQEGYWANIKIKECGISELVKIGKFNITSEEQKGLISKKELDKQIFSKQMLTKIYKIKIDDILAFFIFSFIMALIILSAYRIIKDRRKERKRTEHEKRWINA